MSSESNNSLPLCVTAAGSPRLVPAAGSPRLVPAAGLTALPHSISTAQESTRTFKYSLKALLKNTAGFSLAEQLLSIIFIGFLCIAVSAGIGAALAAYGSIADTAHANQMLSRSVQEINDQLAYSLDAEEGGVRFFSASANTIVELTNDAAESGIMMSGSNIGGPAVNSVLFIPQANGVVPYLSEQPRYDRSTNTWRYTLQILKDNTVLTQREVTVARVMPPVAEP